MKNEYAGRLNILTRVSTGSKLGQTRIIGGEVGREDCVAMVGRTEDERSVYSDTLTLSTTVCTVYS